MKKEFLIVGIIIASLLCLAPAVFAADGFGQYTTGGAGGAVVTVDSDPILFKSYVETPDVPYIIQVQGTIDLGPLEDGDVRIQSNKTIRGIGDNPTIIGSLGFKNGCSNVIIERLNITCPRYQAEEEDGISVKDDITNVFITKCTFYDCWDGCVDIARRSDWVTVSWCKFYFTFRNTNNDRVSLVGNTDSPGDEGTLHVTFHHNWFGQYCMQRMPSVRYGRGHIYNNYYNCPGDIYCIWSRIQAECLIENNYFDSVNDPYSIYIKNEPPEEYGKIAASGNIFINCTGQVDDGDDIVFTPPYAHTLDDAEDVPITVQNGAGADGNDTFLPHWLFGPYGDFDRSDIVDINDLEQFVEYWLDTNDIDDINDADYDDDGIVNSFEFALLAENWLKLPPDLTAPAAPENLWALAGNGTVSLDWDNNNEPDLEGYNLYRTTTSGSGYTKLNSPLLTDSNYIDDTVINGTIYYYVVTALDTSENESGNSVEACAVPSADGNNITIQEYATGFCNVDGIIDNKHAGYTGSGFCDTENATGEGIDWCIDIAAADTYTFTWRYAHGKTDDRSARLLVNGSPVISSIAFPPTGAFTTWSTVSVDVSLTEGIKDIRLEGITINGLANIDYLMVTGPDPQIASCP